MNTTANEKLWIGCVKAAFADNSTYLLHAVYSMFQYPYVVSIAFIIMVSSANEQTIELDYSGFL